VAPNDGLGDEGDHLIRAEPQNLIFERLRGARGIGLVALTLEVQAIGVARVDMMSFDPQRAKLRTAPFVAAGGERAERVAVIALAPRDDMAALRLAFLDKKLARHLERRLDRLRAAADEIDAGHAGGRVRDEAIGKLLRDLRGEEAGMGVSDGVELAMQCGENIGMAMAEAGDGGAARGVEVALAVAVDEFDALAADGDRHRGIGGAVEDVGH
jgi:HAMP domain-containing protein